MITFEEETKSCLVTITVDGKNFTGCVIDDTLYWHQLPIYRDDRLADLLKCSAGNLTFSIHMGKLTMSIVKS